MTPLQAIKDICDSMLKDESSDDHGRETILRAFLYAERRLREGAAKTESEAKLAMASFADGFCTGHAVGGGKPCPHGMGPENKS